MGHRRAFVGGLLLDPPHPAVAGTLVVEDERIVAAGPGVEVPAGAETILLDGGIVAPGFIDVHVHGGAGSDFMDGTPEAVRTVCRYHAAGGTTGLLATTAAAPLSQLLEVLGVIARVQQGQQAPTVAQQDQLVKHHRVEDARVLGVHLEGPYFSPAKHGCHLAQHIRLPRPEEYRQLLGTYRGLVRWVTLAPEVEGALPLIRELRARGIVASAGHTEAVEAQVLAAIEAGLGHATHLYNAMSTITKDGPRRIPGLLETTLANDALTTEVIADGYHLAPALLRIAARAKGPERLLLVTDAMRGAGMPDGVYTFGPPDGAPAIVEHGVARTPDNTGYASSTVQTIDLVRTMVRLAGCRLEQAVQMASTTPATALGLGHRKGRLLPGYDADLVILDLVDGQPVVRETFVGGWPSPHPSPSGRGGSAPGETLPSPHPSPSGRGGTP